MSDRFELFLEEPEAEIVNLVDGREALRHLERVGRTCYRSEDRITSDSYAGFLRGVIDRGHEAMLEHVSVTIRFRTDRGVTHELVRHRLAAYAQSSTRYCNYSQDRFGNGIHVIKPLYFNPQEEPRPVEVPTHSSSRGCTFPSEGVVLRLCAFDVWMISMFYASWAYLTLTRVFGRQPQEARSVLPQSTASDIYVTCNLREWRHIFNLRALGTTGAPHPDMRRIMLPALAAMRKEFPLLFDDIYEQCVEKGFLEKAQAI